MPSDTTTEPRELDLDDEQADGSVIFSEFGHAHDKRLIAEAIEDYVPDLRKLEKANNEKGYLRNARIVKGDADRLHDVLLKSFTEEQLDLDAEPGPVEVRSGIANQLHNLVRRYVRDSIGPEDNPVSDFENELCQRLERFGRVLTEMAYAAGYRDRAEHPSAFMLRCIGELEHKELAGAEG